MAEMSLEEGLDTLGRRANVSRFVIWFYIGLSVLLFGVEAGELAGFLSLEGAESDPLTFVAGITHLSYALCLFVSFVVIGMWIHRAHANLFAAGIDGLEFTPGWSVGWFFIPIANLFKPFQAMRELWNASHNQSDSFSSPADSNLSLWWGTWIIGNILSNLSARSGFSEDGSAGSAILVVDMISTAILLVCAWILLRIIERVTAAQQSMTGLAQTFA